MFRVYDSEWKDGEDWRREYLEVAEVEKLARKNASRREVASELHVEVGD